MFTTSQAVTQSTLIPATEGHRLPSINSFVVAFTDVRKRLPFRLCVFCSRTGSTVAINWSRVTNSRSFRFMRDQKFCPIQQSDDRLHHANVDRSRQSRQQYRSTYCSCYSLGLWETGLSLLDMVCLLKYPLCRCFRYTLRIVQEQPVKIMSTLRHFLPGRFSVLLQTTALSHHVFPANLIMLRPTNI